jgi:hypothetical protein
MVAHFTTHMNTQIPLQEIFPPPRRLTFLRAFQTFAARRLQKLNSDVACLKLPTKKQPTNQLTNQLTGQNFKAQTSALVHLAARSLSLGYYTGTAQV